MSVYNCLNQPRLHRSADRSPPRLNICLRDLGELTQIRERMLFHATLVRWVVNPIPLQETCMRSVVVTGTSSGIGWGIAKILTAKGFRVFGSVRKKDRRGASVSGAR